jgi:cation diffusion facilitator family transporter
MSPDLPMTASTHQHDLGPFKHAHAFGDGGEKSRGQALLAVTVVTLVTMVAELIAGWWTGSLALTADGWHMGTHAAALGGAVLAMRWSARARHHEGFAFGGWKIEVLAAYTSALLLAAVALGLAFEAVQHLITPSPIAYGEALVVAALGLAVNLVSVWLLSRSGHDAHGHGHGPNHGHSHDTPQAHGHDHGHDHPGHHDHARPAKAGQHHDHNFRAAYVHVLADAFTSLLAMAALAAGLWWGWRWLDPVVALVGSAVIAQWSWGLLQSTSFALVDATADAPLRQAVTAAIESDHDAKLADLHIWQVGPQAFSAVISVVADHPLSPAEYRARLAPLTSLRHITVEVHCCPQAARPGAPAG